MPNNNSRVAKRLKKEAALEAERKAQKALIDAQTEQALAERAAAKKAQAGNASSPLPGSSSPPKGNPTSTPPLASDPLTTPVAQVASLSSSATDSSSDWQKFILPPDSHAVPLSQKAITPLSNTKPAPSLSVLFPREVLAIETLKSKLAVLNAQPSKKESYEIEIEKILTLHALADLCDKPSAEEGAHFKAQMEVERNYLDCQIYSTFIDLEYLKRLEVKDAVKEYPLFVFHLFFEKYLVKLADSKNISFDISKATEDLQKIYSYETELNTCSRQLVFFRQNSKVSPTLFLQKNLEEEQESPGRSEKRTQIYSDLTALFDKIMVEIKNRPDSEALCGRDFFELTDYFRQSKNPIESKSVESKPVVINPPPKSPDEIQEIQKQINKLIAESSSLETPPIDSIRQAYQFHIRKASICMDLIPLFDSLVVFESTTTVKKSLAREIGIAQRLFLNRLAINKDFDIIEYLKGEISILKTGSDNTQLKKLCLDLYVAYERVICTFKYIAPEWVSAVQSNRMEYKSLFQENGISEGALSSSFARINIEERVREIVDIDNNSEDFRKKIKKGIGYFSRKDLWDFAYAGPQYLYCYLLFDYLEVMATFNMEEPSNEEFNKLRSTLCLLEKVDSQQPALNTISAKVTRDLDSLDGIQDLNINHPLMKELYRDLKKMYQDTAKTLATLLITDVSASTLIGGFQVYFSALAEALEREIQRGEFAFATHPIECLKKPAKGPMDYNHEIKSDFLDPDGRLNRDRCTYLTFSYFIDPEISQNLRKGNPMDNAQTLSPPIAPSPRPR